MDIQKPMVIYCWGSTEHGELGLGGIEDENILTPRLMNWNQQNLPVLQISCGNWHTLFLTSNGKIFSCGNNDNGQLGHEGVKKRPHLIAELENYTMTSTSCGAQHSMALTTWNQIYVWGNNKYGQLGITDNSDRMVKPRILKMLASKNVVQIACGNNHSLALTNSGELYSWGSNTYGQLGVAPQKDLESSNVPHLITALQGIPIAYITCGGNHSFVISKSGAVFSWGRNDCGQLGVNDNDDRCYPTQLKTLRSLGVRYISCGDAFSVFLTNDGGVFTCGSNRYGQLGHGKLGHGKLGHGYEGLPRKVTELMGSTVTQIACGTNHTLALVPSRGRVYCFGLNCAGQLGIRENNSPTPQQVFGPWVSPSGQSLIKSEINDDKKESYIIKQIFSGGNHSFATCTEYKSKIPAVDCRLYDLQTQVLSLTEELCENMASIEPDSMINSDLLAIVEFIFKSAACINGSFLLPNYGHLCCTSKHPGVDFKSAERAFRFLSKIENERLKSVIWEKITDELLSSLPKSPPDVETLRIYLLLPMYHEFVNSKNYEKLHIPFSNTVLNLKEIPKKIVAKWWCQTSAEWYEQIITYYKHVIIHIITIKIQPTADSGYRKVCDNKILVDALIMLLFLYVTNMERKDILHYEVFQWPELPEYIDIEKEYGEWISNTNSNSFSICNFPFLFNAAAKTKLLHTDQNIQMHLAIRNNLYTSMRNSSQPKLCVILIVSRENLVQDTITEINLKLEDELKLPLKVKFTGEEAEDGGGVRKEFFMLVLKELIDPRYSMFKEYDEDSRVMWFSDVTFETDATYLLIGTVCGLAIYNFTIINLPFPLALYKKLLNVKVDLSDLKELSPTVARSMQYLLDYDGDDFEEEFGLHFEISKNIFGESTTEPLKENGEDIAVTKENRQEYVDLYVDYVFNKSVNKQFHAFQRGFMKVCYGRVLKIFRPEELMAMVVGNEEYDWNALELACEYKDGYTSSDETIKWFWEIFHDLSLIEKKKFLLFLTGSDRIPIQGMKEIKICIRCTRDDEFLPVAHTCFNLLDLPCYTTKECLKYKLLQAIQYTQGFSLV